ncbi:MAG: intermembrane transport protein PqiB [Opitutae bacterium]|jgi:paraquat-inducible protein B|nr:intermembrane transport protein PqiB [Opitutae bacterium]MDG2344650.1 intermembrane transport protein PqiB [Opitutae bacterium]
MTDIAAPTIDTRKRLSVIWMIPLVALALGVWMVVHAKLSEGPVVEIHFATAESIEAGKTKVRYLNVEVGQVEEVRLSDDMKGVVAMVRVDQDARHLLREETQFWVVRARVGAGNISGLGTLLGGAYIELSPGGGTVEQRNYVGLETPPLTPAGAPGIKLNLLSEHAGSVNTGDSVLYNGYKVGRIEGMGFDDVLNLVRYDVFIDAPFDTLINSSVRFWNISGISVSASASGVEVQTGSLDTILLGGVAFHLPEGADVGSPVESGADFKLYDNFASMQEQPYQYSIDYVVEFSQSLRGLLPGAPVEYRGIPIGTVKRIMAAEVIADMHQKNGAPIPVLITIEPGRVGLPDTAESVVLMQQDVADSVSQGFRASLETGSLLTGSLYINVDYHPDAEPEVMGEYAGRASIPTIQTGLGRIEEQVIEFLSKANELPVAETLKSVDTMVNSLTETLRSMDELLSDQEMQQLSAEMMAAIKELRGVLTGLSPEGPAFQSFESSVGKLNETLANLDELTRTLKDQPNALILPTKFPADPTPGATY